MPTGRNNKLLLSNWLLLVFLALAPLIVTDIPALMDYPNHLARQFILLHYETSSALQANYRIDWGIKPNLAMDIIIPWLAGFMPLLWAGKIFIVLTLLALLGGTAALAHALHGQVGVPPMFAAVFLYNLAFAFGLLNFLFGSGLMMLAFSLWIRCPFQPVLIRSLVFSVFAIILFFCHLFAVATFFLLTGAYELQKWPGTTWGNRLSGIVSLAVPVAITFALWLLRTPGIANTNDIDWGEGWLRAVLMAGGLIFSDRCIPFLVLIPVAFTLLCFNARGLPIIRSMWLPLGLIFFIALLMPKRLAGGDSVHLRLPVLLPFLVAASIPPRLISHRTQLTYMLMALGLTAYHSYDAIGLWHKADSDFSEFRKAALAVEPGARMMLVEDVSTDLRSPLYLHMIELSVLDRCTFVAHMAKIQDQQPVIPAPAVQDIDGGVSGYAVSSADFIKAVDPQGMDDLRRQPPRFWRKLWFLDWQHKFDYIVHVDWGAPINLRPEYLDIVNTGSFFTIYRVKDRPRPASLSCP